MTKDVTINNITWAPFYYLNHLNEIKELEWISNKYWCFPKV